jgi:predicted RNA-binding Zn-ribbon protein involved in translation (DUF1610 family)
MTESNYKLVAVYQYSFEALVCKGKLESENIEVFVKDNHTIDTNPLYSNAIGGVKLFVNAADLEKAKAILDQTSKFSLDDANNLMKCPNCGAEKIEMGTSVQNVKSLFTFVLGILITPFAFFIKHKYRCEACNFEFK